MINKRFLGRPVHYTLFGQSLGRRFGAYYYVSSASGAEWAEMVAEEPSVRLRIAGNIYPVSASSVTDPAELDGVVAGYMTKYDVAPEKDSPPGVAVFRLAAR